MKKNIQLHDLPHLLHTVPRKGFLKTSGTIDTNVYYIESGTVRVFFLDGDEEQTIRFGYNGNLITALDSYLTGMPSPLYIQALKKTIVRIIRKEVVESFLQEEPNRQMWIAMMEDLVLQQMEREADLLTNSPKERYLRVLNRSPQLFQQVPNRYIANYLRMIPETLSRLKKS